jgi:hypothetical protein
MQQIVQSLAQGLQQLSQDVEGQAKGGMMPPPEMEMEENEEEESDEDEEFLKSMMEEGNSKTK